MTDATDVTDVAMTDRENGGDEKTQIRVTKAQRAELHDMKRPEDSYADVLGRLLESAKNTEQSG